MKSILFGREDIDNAYVFLEERNIKIVELSVNRATFLKIVSL